VRFPHIKSAVSLGSRLRPTRIWPLASDIHFPAGQVIGVPDRGEHRQAAKRAAADIEGHSQAAKFGQPGRLRRKLLRVLLYFQISEQVVCVGVGSSYHRMASAKSPTPPFLTARRFQVDSAKQQGGPDPPGRGLFSQSAFQ